MNETEKILNNGETVLWEGRPQFLPYILSMFPTIIFGLIWTGLSGLFLVLSLRQSGVPWFVIALVSFFVLIGLSLLLLSPLYTLLVYKHIWYVITDKRVIFQRGLIGRDFDFADYDKVESATVNVGVVDKLFGKNSGSVAIYANRLMAGRTTDGNGDSHSYTRNVPFVMLSITDPYNTFTLFKKVSHDIKTDVYYPNALRPDENKGYKTEYKPEE
ncbi:MAG: PH domain-containing protein [Patescibacteria group bacterium]